MLLLQVASLVVGISLLTVSPPRLVEAVVPGQDSVLLGADPNAPSSKGSEFILGFIGNTDNAPIDSATAALFVTTDDPGPVAFTVEYFGTILPFEARSGSSTLVNLPVGKSGEIGDIRVTSEAERNKGIRVKSTDPTKLLTVYGINDADVSTDAFLALPCHSYGNVAYKYFVFSANTESTTGTFQSRFLIVGCDDATTVTIRPKQQITLSTDLTGAPVPININPDPTQPMNSGTFTINQLQTAQFSSPDDLTGTIIESDKPISVFVGHECGQVPDTATACDHLVEQVPPSATWGTQFFTVPLDVRESGERFRVGTVIDDNQVTVTCTTEGQTTPRLQKMETIHSQRNLQQYVEFDTIGDPTDGITTSYRRDFCCIETTKPAIVMMYSKGHSVDEITLPGVTGTQGDPFMLLVPPVSQYSNDYTATTAKQVRTDFIGHIGMAFPAQFFDNSTIDRSAVTINGTTFTPDSGYLGIYCSNGQVCAYGAYSGVPVGSHEVRYDMAGAGMNLFVYGFLREISFAYPAGFEMQAIGVPRISIFNITVLESVGTVRIPINRTGGDLSLTSVIRAFSRDVTAIEGEDYRRLPDQNAANPGFRVRWEEDESEPRFITNPNLNRDPIFEVEIIDDNVPEPPGREYFEIDLSLNPTGNGRNGFFYPNAVGRVTIIDDDVPPQIGFQPESYTVDEAAGVARLTITTNEPGRFTDGTGALFYTEDGTATGGGVDFMGYTRANATPITFPAGSTETTIEVPINNDRLVERTEQFTGRIVSGGGINNLNIFAPTATVDITDNDRLIFGFEQPAYNFSESVGTGNLGVRLSPDSGLPSENFVFTFMTANGTAVATDDYINASMEYTFMPGGDTRLDIPVTIINDAVFEGAEQFLGRLSTSADAIIDVPVTTVNIYDDDRIAIGFNPASYSYNEDVGVAELTFQKFSDPASLEDNITVVFFTSNGSAEAGNDYISVSSLEVIFLPGEATKTVQVVIIDDNDLEPDLETFFGNLVISSESASIAEVTVPLATVDIMDNDERIEVGFDPIEYPVTEGEAAMLRVVLSMAYTEEITVSLQTNEGNATDPEDYTGVTTVITFAAGVTKQNVSVQTIDDSSSEGAESFTATLSNASPSDVVAITQPQATVNIADNDVVAVSFDMPNYTVDEDNGTATVCFRTNGGHPDRPIYVTVEPAELADGSPECTDYPSASANTDFRASVLSQTFAASPMGDLLCVGIRLIGDNRYEGNEQFVVRFAPPGNVPNATSRIVLGENPQACVTIVDNDVRPFNFEFPNITIPEPNGTANVCITMTGATDVPITVTARTGPKGGASNPATVNSDYTNTTFTLIFTSPDEGSVTRCALVPILDDNLGNEPVEPFSVTIVGISPAGSGQVGSSSETCVFIVDDDVPKISWIDSNVTIPEGGDGSLCFMSDIGTAQPYNVIVGIDGKGANPALESDYTSGMSQFTFSSMSSEMNCLDLSAIDDNVDEPLEQLQLVFSNLPSSFAGVGNPSTACVNIEDNDMPEVRWNLPQISVNEGEDRQVCFNRSVPSSQPYQIQVGVREKGTKPATNGVDYIVPVDLTFEIDLSTPLQLCVSLSIIDDTLGEGMEQFEFYFVDVPSDSATIGTPATTCVNIIDDDVVEVNIVTDNPMIPENIPGGVVEICFSLSTNITQPVTVTAVTGPKSGATNPATAGMDYSTTTLTVTFEPGDQELCDNVPIINDTLGNEENEQFSVTITDVSSSLVTIGPIREACVIIIDDDMPIIEWDEPEVNITEGERRLICFSSDIGSDVLYPVQVRVDSKGDGAIEATNGVDYTITSLRFEIPASNSGESACVDVSTIEDNIAENTEQFVLFFENLPSNFAAAGMPDTVCVSIVDDEEPEVNVDIPDISVPENQTEVEICISLNTGVSENVVVTAETGPKSGAANQASEDDDYETNVFMLTFEPSADGRTLCGNVRIIDDKLANEGNEQFSVTITSISGSRVDFGPNDETCVTIIDDDVPVVAWDEESVTIIEGGNRLVCFSNDIGTAQSYDVTVGARGKGAGATRDVDYTLPAASLSVSFTSLTGGQQFCIDITTIDDSIGEGTEQFELYFDNFPSASAREGTPSVLCVNIQDNDSPVVVVEKPDIDVPENQTDVEICLTLTTGITERAIVTAETGAKSGAADQASADVDYTTRTLMLTFEPSLDGRTLCGRVPIINDNLDERNEQFSVTITNVSNTDVMIGPSRETCVTIIDDDVPEIKWEDPDVTIPEGDDGRVCFSSSSGSVAPYQVVVGVRGKSSRPAVDPEDYTIGTPLTFTIPASNAGDQFCLDISTIDDTKVEGTEQFELYFENLPSSSAALGSPETVCVSIADDDQLTVSFEREMYSAGESDGNAQVCVVTNTGHADSVDVVVMSVEKPTAANPASGNTDFRVSTQTITFPANVTGNTLCVDIGIIGDSLDEYDEQFLVQFGNIPNAQAGLGAIPEACVTIVDDDVPRFNIGPPEKNVSESDGRCRICITTNSPLGRNVTVIARTGPKSGAENQATADADYESTEIVVMFRPSDEGSTQELCGYVPIIDDMIGNELDEEFSVTLVSASPDGDFGDSESCITITDNDVVGIEFSTMDVTVNENNGTVTVCLMKNITTDGPITVILDAEEETGVPNPASDASDFRPGFGMVIFAPNQTEACGMVEIKNDDDPETPEVFMVTFEASNLVIPPRTDLPPPIAEVTIIDDDRPPSDFITCRINEFMQVQPFTRTTEYRFNGMCEHIAASPCETIGGFDVRVTVDFLTGSMENGAVGLHVNEFRYVSREDGSFDDGGQTPVSSTPTSSEYEATPPTRVSVSFGQGMTNITFDSNTDATDPLDTDIEIVHIYGGDNPSIQISIRTPNMSGISDFCGLCGSRSGSLLRRDGNVANESNMEDVQTFAQSYLVEPRDQILRPQRRECGTIRNDTVIGDPLYAVPVYSEELKEKYSLCYEVFGRANSTLNLVSDTCVNVNARYGPMDNPEDGNIIRAVGVRARGLSANSCHNIRVDLEGCSATVETPSGDSQSLASMERFEQDGISVRKYPRRVRISAPNCENVMLVMWVVCETRNDQDMIRFVIARGVNLRASSHGLLGQFWNIPVSFSKYNGTDLPAGTDLSRVYVVTVEPPSPPARSFLGHLYHLKWDKTREDCVYVGNAQGGPSFEVLDPNDSVIQGRYRDYILSSGDLFETSYTYSEFEEARCS